MSGKRGRTTIIREEYACLLERGGCGAEIGDFCRTRYGSISASVHAARFDQYLNRKPAEKGLGARIRRDTRRPPLLTFDEWLKTYNTGNSAEVTDWMRDAWEASRINSEPKVRDPWHVSGKHRIARTVKVVRTQLNGPSELFIDGELFPYATSDGYSAHPQRNQLPGVTFTLVAERVEVIDSSLEKGSD